MLPDGALRPFSAEEVLCSNLFNDVRIKTFELHLDGVLLITAISPEPDNGPRTLNGRPGPSDLIEKDPFDFSLVQQHRERVPRVNEPRTAGPIPSSMDATTGFRIPECDIVNPRRLIRHQRALQAQVAQDFCRSWLDTIGTTGRRGHRPIVNVLDAIAPA